MRSAMRPSPTSCIPTLPAVDTRRAAQLRPRQRATALQAWNQLGLRTHELRDPRPGTREDHRQAPRCSPAAEGATPARPDQRSCGGTHTGSAGVPRIPCQDSLPDASRDSTRISLPCLAWLRASWSPPSRARAVRPAAAGRMRGTSLVCTGRRPRRTAPAQVPAAGPPCDEEPPG